MKKEPSAKRKSFLTGFFGALLGSFPAFLAFLVVGFIVFLVLQFAGIPAEHAHIEGLYLWNPSQAENSVEPESKREFFAAYPYSEGNYHGDKYDARKTGRNRNFVWLTYDDPAVYEAAKQSRFDPENYSSTRLKLYPFEDPDVYGFTFYYVGANETFPARAALFGYNDETRTLVFVGFHAYGKKELPHIVAGLSDLSGYLDHYFGEWFDWNAGDRAPD